MQEKIKVFEYLHDSILVEFSVEPSLQKITVVLETLINEKKSMWKLVFTGLLRLDFETLGNGEDDMHDCPIEIYDVYQDYSSKEYLRWKRKTNPTHNDLYHIVLASSFIRGWGENESNEGINVICRNFDISEIQ